MLTSAQKNNQKIIPSRVEWEPPKSQSQNPSLSLGAIFGASRSGTTWLGTLISSHPDVAYRFEPFHRLAKTQPDIERSLKILRSPQLSSEDRSQIYHSLLPAYPEIEKPPFFHKNYQMPLNWGRRAIWPLSRRNPLAGQIFRRLYTPNTPSDNSPTLIFKQVEMVDIVTPFLETLDVPVVYLMRHPCAVVWSRIKGQQNALMPTGRAQKLDNILRDCFPELAEQYAGKLETTTEKEAMLWRIDVESVLSACSKSSRGLPIFYENLVANTVTVVEQIFQHFGLSLTQETSSFIEDSTCSTSNLRQKRGEIGINPYFSVFRNSQAVCDKWKDEMPAEERSRVTNIVGECKAFQMGTEQGWWTT